jgi:type I restriction enzyme S subunit
MELRAGYKQTEVGAIPEDWDVKPLPRVLEFISGKAHEQHISPFGDFVVVNSKFISTDGEVAKYSKVNFCPARQGDILMVMSDLPNGRALAKCFLVEEDRRYAVNQRVCILRPKRSHPRFFFYQLNRNPYFLAFDDGVQQTHLLNGVFRACPVAVPPSIDEQSAIAAALSDADALIASLEAVIAKKRDLKQAVMQQLLTGRTRLPGFGGSWEMKRLGEVLKIRHGKSQKSVEVADGAYPVLATGGEIGRANVFLYDRPSVLIGRKGTIDSPQFVDTPFWTIDTLFFTEISAAAIPKFIFYRFLLIDWRAYNEASGVPSLSSATIEKIEFACPKPDEQSAIATVLSDMDADLTAVEAQRDKARAVKLGMMQELLTGRIRLV